MMRAGILLLTWLLLQPAASGVAQDKAHAKHAVKQSAHKPARKLAGKVAHRSAQKQAAIEDSAPKPAAVAPSPSEGKPAAAAKPSAPSVLDADGSENVKKEAGGEVKVLQFSGLDIEGQLKTPQMLYFLNRLRAEFGRPRLPHRSFLPELQRSTQEKSF